MVLLQKSECCNVAFFAGTALNLTVAYCDGGSKESSSGPSNVLTAAQNSEGNA